MKSDLAKAGSKLSEWGESWGVVGPGESADHPASSPSKPKGGGNGGDDGVPPEDRCARAFSVRLEEIEQSDYYKAHGSIPPVGTPLRVAQRKRLVAQTASGEGVGYLPTAFNYLAACLKAGWSYDGAVQTAANGPPVATITADFVATVPK